MARKVTMEGGMHALMTAMGVDPATWLDSMVRSGPALMSFEHTQARRTATGNMGRKGHPMRYDRTMFDGCVVTDDQGEWFCHQWMPSNYIIPASADGPVVIGWSSPKLTNGAFATTKAVLMNWRPPETVYSALAGRKLGQVFDYAPLCEATILDARQASWSDNPMTEILVTMPTMRVPMTID